MYEYDVAAIWSNARASLVGTVIEYSEGRFVMAGPREYFAKSVGVYCHHITARWPKNACIFVYILY